MLELNIELYKKLYLIRRAEKEIIEHYAEDEMKTPMHMSMGEEAISVGVSHALGKENQVFGTYRSHAAYLAKTQDVDNFFAEMYGKDTSLLKGKGGSMHLCAPKYGFMGTSAIVASAIPVAIGAAYANKRKENGKIVAVFFGDGAIDEGAFWESLNVACLMKLPVLFVCEDNGFAVHTPGRLRHGYDSISNIVAKFNCDVCDGDTTDVEVIYNLSCHILDSIKAKEWPGFLCLKYYRYLEHVGVNEDFEAGYRSREEFEKWYQRDPINLQREKLLGLGVQEQTLKKIEEKIDIQIDRSIKIAQEAAFAKAVELCRNVFYEEDKKD